MELPLFPLNLVLFPGMPLNLHIFEERYKLMINECIDQRKPFGVVLISNKRPDTAHDADAHLIGCTAEITQVQPLKEGRMNIATVGKERFQVQSFQHDKPYLSGTVELYPLASEVDADTIQNSRRLRAYLLQYLEGLQKAKQVQFDANHLPGEPAALAYLASVLLQAEPQEKQSLLAEESLKSLIQLLLTTYRHETMLMETLLNPPENIDFKGVFSLN
jgi:uncharacterized protein